MSKKRCQHSAQFRVQVGLDALKGIEPVHAIAARHSVQAEALMSILSPLPVGDFIGVRFWPMYVEQTGMDRRPVGASY
jgi:hypothetical protein